MGRPAKIERPPRLPYHVTLSEFRAWLQSGLGNFQNQVEHFSAELHVSPARAKLIWKGLQSAELAVADPDDPDWGEVTAPPEGQTLHFLDGRAGKTHKPVCPSCGQGKHKPWCDELRPRPAKSRRAR